MLLLHVYCMLCVMCPLSHQIKRGHNVHRPWSDSNLSTVGRMHHATQKEYLKPKRTFPIGKNRWIEFLCFKSSKVVFSNGFWGPQLKKSWNEEFFVVLNKVVGEFIDLKYN